MTQSEFWEHIEKSRRADPDAHVERLTARLAELRPNEILAFQRHWDCFIARAYSWALWGAAYIINGGCSDDGFCYFRMWLLLQGEAVYHAALKNADSLAEVIDSEDTEADCECNPAIDAYLIATGIGEDADCYDAFFAAYNAQFPKRELQPKLGRGWDFDSDRTMRKKYPRLAALYLARDGNDN